MRDVNTANRRTLFHGRFSICQRTTVVVHCVSTSCLLLLFAQLLSCRATTSITRHQICSLLLWVYQCWIHS